MRRPNLRTFTTAAVALTLPTTILAGVLTAAYFKSSNPDNVDISQSLAYLQQTLIVSAVVFILFVVSIAVGIVRMYKRDQNFVEAKLPLILLIVISIFLLITLFANAYTNQVQDNYLIDNGRPTLKQYFDELEKQNN